MSDLCRLVTGDRVILQPLTASHANALFPLLDDTEVWKYTDSAPPLSVDALRERYRNLETRVRPDGAVWLNWAVERRAGHDITGVVQATIEDEEVSIGYVFGRRYWGQGLGLESVSAMLGVLHAEFGVEHVRATVHPDNRASIRLLERLGFSVHGAIDPTSLLFEKDLGGLKAPA